MKLVVAVLELLSMLAVALGAAAAPNSLTYQGRILKSDGTALQYNNVSFIFKITDPTGQCVIYQEAVTGVDMTNSNGVFDTVIGSGAVNYPLMGNFTVLDAFNNTQSFSCGSCSGYTCTDSSSSYTAADGDSRRLRVQFYDGSSWNTISPDNIIRSVPFAGYALSAQKLGTNLPSDFVLKNSVNGNASCDGGNFLTWNATSHSFGCSGVTGTSGGTVTNVSSTNNYLSVTNGAAAPTLTVNVGQVANTVAAGDDTRIVNALQSGSAAGGDLSGTLPSPKVAKIQGIAVNSSAPSSGNFFKYDGTNWVGSVIATSDVAGLDTALNGKLNTSLFPASCGASQTLTFISPTGGFSCSNIAISDSQITYASQGANKFLAAPASGSGAPTFRVMDSTDLPAGTLSGTGTAGYVPYYNTTSTLANSPIYTSGGNVGIGTTSPGSSQLMIANSGNTALTLQDLSATKDTTNFTARMRIVDSAGTLSGQVGFAGGSQDMVVSNLNSSGSLALATAGTIRATIDSSGKVGIGTTTPSQPLHVVGTQLISRFQDSGNGGYLTLSRARGTITAPTVVQSGDSLGNVAFAGYDGAATQIGAQIYGVVDGTVAGGSVPSALSFNTGYANGGAPRMRIDSSGNVGIGTISPVSQLHVGTAPAANAKYPLFALGNGAFDGSTTGYFAGSANGTFIGVNAASAYTGDFVNFQIAGASKFKIDNAGNITSSGNLASSGNTTSSGNYTTSGNIITTGTGTITSAGGIVDSSLASSTSPSTGALVVSGGAGVDGDLYAGASINASTTMTAGTSLTTPKIYGGSATSSTLTLSGTSNAAPATNAYVLLQPTSGSVGIGTTTPSANLDIKNSSSGAQLALSSVNTQARFIALDGGAGHDSYLDIGAYPTTSSDNAAIRLFRATSTTGRKFFEIMKGDGTVTADTHIGVGENSFFNLSGGNVGIGTTNPSASLDIEKSTDGGLLLAAQANGVTNPANQTFLGLYAYTSDYPTAYLKNTGMFYLGSDNQNMQFAVPNASGVIRFLIGSYSDPAKERLRIDSNGNVGIGTTAPIVPLNIATNAASPGIYLDNYSTSSSTNPVLIGRSSRGTAAAPSATLSNDNLFFVGGRGDTGTGFAGGSRVSLMFAASENWSATANGTKMIFFTTQNGTSATTERMRIADNGNVGIGTTNPGSTLTVSGSTNFTNTTTSAPASAATSSQNVTVVIAPSADASTSSYRSLTMSAQPNTANTINEVDAGWFENRFQSGQTGNISNTYGLQAYGAFFDANSANFGTVSNAFGLRATAVNAITGATATGSVYNAVGAMITDAVTQGSIAITNNAGLMIAGLTHGTNNTGLLLGGSSIPAGNFSLYSASAYTSYFAGSVGIGTTSPAYPLTVNGDVSIASAKALRFGATSVCTSTGCTASSDRRLKENIKPLENSLDKVLKLQGVSFDYKDKAQFTDKHQIGVIAQEVEKIYPEAVTTDGKTGFKAVAYDHLIAPVIEAMKELYRRVVDIENHQVTLDRQIASVESCKAESSAKIQKLESENAEMKARLDRLEKMMKD